MRHRLFSIAATLARTSRQRLLHIKKTAVWAGLFTTAAGLLAPVVAVAVLLWRMARGELPRRGLATAAADDRDGRTEDDLSQ